MMDLNTLIPAGSGWELIDAYNINDRGEILVDAIPAGTPPVQTGQLGHLALLVPCDGVAQSCDSAQAAAIPTAVHAGNRVNAWLERLGQRFRVSGRD